MILPEYGFSGIGSDTNVYHPKSSGNCCNALNFNEGKYLGSQCANMQMPARRSLGVGGWKCVAKLGENVNETYSERKCQ